MGFSVSSLDEAIAFWTAAMGFELVRTGEMGGDFLREVTGRRRSALPHGAGGIACRLPHRTAGILDGPHVGQDTRKRWRDRRGPSCRHRDGDRRRCRQDPGAGMALERISATDRGRATRGNRRCLRQRARRDHHRTHATSQVRVANKTTAQLPERRVQRSQSSCSAVHRSSCARPRPPGDCSRRFVSHSEVSSCMVRGASIL